MVSHEADLVVVGGIVLTADRDWNIYDPGVVAVDGGAIVGLGPREEVERVYRGRERIDASDKLVMPGLINAHTHAPMTLFRGIADDLPLETWLYKYIWPAETKLLSPDFVRLGTQLAAAEMIRSGTVLFCDMYYFEDDIAEACKEAGIRVVIGEALVDFPTANCKTPEDQLNYTEHLLSEWHDDSLVIPSVQPHSPYAASSDLMQQAKALADQYGAPYLLHVSETQSEVQESIEKYGHTPVGRLADLGLLGPTTVAIHGVHLTDEDIELLAQYNAGVVHCPESQLKLASGFTPVPKLLEAGVKVGLGTDGAASNNDLDMFGEVGTAAKVHKMIAGDPTAMPARQALSMATLEAARVLGLDDRLGSLEVGKRGDMIILDLDVPHMVPVYNVTSHLVYAAHSSDVRTVIIDGRVVMRDRVLLTLDEGEIFARAREMARQIVAGWGA
ncbi:MAG: amidohydrolase family protein [Anaerolineae bacterium]